MVKRRKTHAVNPAGQRMNDPEKTRSTPAAAAVDDSLPVTSKDSAVALVDAGNALEEQGRYAEAMARYDSAVAPDPRCARAHLNRGNVLLAAAQIDAARDAYQLAIACDPRYAAAHLHLGKPNFRPARFLGGFRPHP